MGNHIAYAPKPSHPKPFIHMATVWVLVRHHRTHASTGGIQIRPGKYSPKCVLCVKSVVPQPITRVDQRFDSHIAWLKQKGGR